jgi:hypothetical protein
MEQPTNNINDIQRQIDTATKIERIETMTEEIYHRLFGNGQPGELDKLKFEAEKLKTEIKDLQTTRSWAKGVMSTLGLLVTGDIGMHLKNFFKN